MISLGPSEASATSVVPLFGALQGRPLQIPNSFHTFSLGEANSVSFGVAHGGGGQRNQLVCFCFGWGPCWGRPEGCLCAIDSCSLGFAEYSLQGPQKFSSWFAGVPWGLAETNKFEQHFAEVFPVETSANSISFPLVSWVSSLGGVVCEVFLWFRWGHHWRNLNDIIDFSLCFAEVLPGWASAKAIGFLVVEVGGGLSNIRNRWSSPWGDPSRFHKLPFAFAEGLLRQTPAISTTCS